MNYYLKKLFGILLCTIPLVNHASQQPTTRVQALEQLAIQKIIPQLETVLPGYYQALRSGQSFTQAKESFLEQPLIARLPEMLKEDLLSPALYKKYEPELLKVILNRPLHTIEFPATNFEFDSYGKHFFADAVAYDETLISIWNTSDIANGKMHEIIEDGIDGHALSTIFNPNSTKLYASFPKKAGSLDLPSGHMSTFAELPDDDESLYDNFDFIFLGNELLYASIIHHDDNHHTFRLASADKVLKEIDYTDELQPAGIMQVVEGTNRIYILQSDDSVRFIDPITLAEQTIPPQEHPISMTHAINNMFFMGDDQGNITVWDLSNQAPIIDAPIITIAGQGNPVSYIGLSSDGGKGAFAFDNSNDIALYNIETLQKFTLKGHSDRVNSVEFTPDNQYLVSTSQDGTLQIWDVNERSLINAAATQDNPVLRAKANITGHSPEAGQLSFFKYDDPNIPFYIFTCAAVGEDYDEDWFEEDIEHQTNIRMWFMPKKDFFNFDQTFYLLAMAKLLDNSFLKTFESRKQYDTYIDGLMDTKILQTFSLPLRQNFISFLEEQKAKKIAPAMTARFAEAP